MNTEQVISLVKLDPNRAALSKATGIPYYTICKIAQGLTKNPRGKTLDALRDYFCNQDRRQ